MDGGLNIKTWRHFLIFGQVISSPLQAPTRLLTPFAFNVASAAAPWFASAVSPP
jgi:hypothetical protein